MPRLSRRSSSSSRLAGSAVTTVTVEPSTSTGQATYCRRYFGERAFRTGRCQRELISQEERDAVLCRDCSEHVLGGRSTHGDQGLAKPLAIAPSPPERLLQRLRADDAGLEEDLPQRATSSSDHRSVHRARIILLPHSAVNALPRSAGSVAICGPSRRSAGRR